tara:strand:+ start:8203 stop:8913 length:711 start_codon:yes stop_codon:yes gene_type:complete
MNRIALSLILGLFFIQAQSQRGVSQVITEYLLQFQFDKTTKFEDVDLETLKYVGSPYQNESFLAGEIYHNNKLIADNIPLRYNALMDEMEFKPSFETPDNESSALMKSPEVDVRIGSKVFIFVPYQGGIEKGGYFDVLLRGEKIDLFKKYNKKYTPEQKAQTSMTRDVPARFTNNPVYYLVLQDGRFIEIPSRARNFTDAFVDKEKEIKSFIKDKKLDIKDENHIIQIVNYYNSII